jgi:hypothetical protein
MQNAELYRTQGALPAPHIVCEPLAVFDDTRLEAVRHAFRAVPPSLFQQAWLDEEETGFSPGTVRMARRGDSLLIFAALTDADIFNGATKLNQRTWELGDVFEIFLRSSAKESYVEFHITPGNQRLQLHYPDRRSVEHARKAGSFDEFLVPGNAFHSRTWVGSREGHWNVFAEIPAVAVCGPNESIGSTPWRFSFGRYDYTRGVKDPVVSSTSPHAKPDFHRLHEWGVMTFNSIGNQLG